jgi:transcription antitermination factor NusG
MSSRSRSRSPEAAQQLVTDELPVLGGSTRWCVARTRPQAEHWAHLNLLRLGFEVYLPLCTVRRRDRVLRTLIHIVEVPLFRSYMFVRHEPGTSWRPIRSAPGVTSIVCTGHEIRYAAVGAVALQATEALRRTPATLESLLRPGAACRLLAGPFKGKEAVVAEINGNNTVVAVLLFGELRRIVVPLDALNPRDDD